MVNILLVIVAVVFSLGLIFNSAKSAAQKIMERTHVQKVQQQKKMNQAEYIDFEEID